jgi:hypothetical protein
MSLKQTRSRSGEQPVVLRLRTMHAAFAGGGTTAAGGRQEGTSVDAEVGTWGSRAG